MTGKQSGMYSMQRRVSDLLKKNVSLISELPTFINLQSLFDTNLNEIGLLTEQQEADISGLRKQKRTMRATCSTKTMNVRRRLVAFAKITGNEVLAKTVNYTEWDLSKVSDNDFISACSVICSEAEKNQAAMIEYGVTPETVIDLKETINAYKAIVDVPKEASTGKKQITDRLAALFDLNAGLLIKMDALIAMLKDSHPEFYAEYQDTRKVVYRTGSLTLKFNATDASTGLPLSGANVKFVMDEELKLEKITAAGGGLSIKTMDEGIYNLTVSKTGYATQDLIVHVVPRELNSVAVAMVKA